MEALYGVTKLNELKQSENFINDAKVCGKYGLPKLKATKYIPYNLLPFNLAKTEKEPTTKWVHFFIDDYQFERIWNFPNRYIPLLKKFAGVITPDFSMHASMPNAQKIWNCYRNRVMAAWFEQNGIKIIPVVEWAQYSDLEWCLDGLAKNSSIAIETYGCNDNGIKRYGLIKGIEKVCNELSPANLIIYGKRIGAIETLCKNVLFFENYCMEIKKRV